MDTVKLLPGDDPFLASHPLGAVADDPRQESLPGDVADDGDPLLVFGWPAEDIDICLEFLPEADAVSRQIPVALAPGLDLHGLPSGEHEINPLIAAGIDGDLVFCSGDACYSALRAEGEVARLEGVVVPGAGREVPLVLVDGDGEGLEFSLLSGGEVDVEETRASHLSKGSSTYIFPRWKLRPPLITRAQGFASPQCFW